MSSNKNKKKSRKIGAPPTTSFEFIQTVYWYHQIAFQISQSLIEKMNLKIHLLENEYKEAAIIKGIKTKLKSANDYVNRLNSKDGLRYTEIKRFLENKEENHKARNVTGLFSSKVWRRYANAENGPEDFLPKQIKCFFPYSEIDFNEGPCLIFNVLKASSLREATEAFWYSLNYAISKSVLSNNLRVNKAKAEIKKLVNENRRGMLKKEIEIMETKIMTAKEKSKRLFLESSLGPDRQSASTQIKHFQFILSNLAPPYYNFNRSKLDEKNLVLEAADAASLHIACSFIFSRYFDEPLELIVSCFNEQHLKTIQDELGIVQTMWFDNTVEDDKKILNEFTFAAKVLLNNKNRQDDITSLGIDYKTILGQ
ncbi:MAG: hypothetical protein GY928_06895 [Colwellia sp.]|nr:hypothetical protein [Colwellia sp.]